MLIGGSKSRNARERRVRGSQEKDSEYVISVVAGIIVIPCSRIPLADEKYDYQFLHPRFRLGGQMVTTPVRANRDLNTGFLGNAEL